MGILRPATRIGGGPRTRSARRRSPQAGPSHRFAGLHAESSQADCHRSQNGGRCAAAGDCGNRRRCRRSPAGDVQERSPEPYSCVIQARSKRRNARPARRLRLRGCRLSGRYRHGQTNRSKSCDEAERIEGKGSLLQGHGQSLTVTGGQTQAKGLPAYLIPHSSAIPSTSSSSRRRGSRAPGAGATMASCRTVDRVSLPAPVVPQSTFRSTLLSSCAFSATTMVETDMSTAPAAGERVTPAQAKSPAAAGMANAL